MAAVREVAGLIAYRLGSVAPGGPRARDGAGVAPVARDSRCWPTHTGPAQLGRRRADLGRGPRAVAGPGGAWPRPASSPRVPRPIEAISPVRCARWAGVRVAPKRVREHHLRQWYVLGDLHDRAGDPIEATRGSSASPPRPRLRRRHRPPAGARPLTRSPPPRPASVACAEVKARHFRAGVVVVVGAATARCSPSSGPTPRPVAAPPGRHRAGEEPIDAAWRELEEETGLGPADVDARRRAPRVGRLRVAGRGRRRAATASARSSGGSRSGSSTTTVEPAPDGREFVAWRVGRRRRGCVDHVVAFRRPAYAPGARRHDDVTDDLFSRRPPSSVCARQAPLAARLRPRTIDDVVGQRHLLGPGRPLRRLVEQDRLSSVLLWGPPGTGKTTLALAVAGTRRGRSSSSPR